MNMSAIRGTKYRIPARKKNQEKVFNNFLTGNEEVTLN